MTIYIPYFYIIRHVPSGKLYAGSKYAKDANPNNFMTPNGYQTSSKKIHRLIIKDGLSSFEILRIDTYCDGVHPYDYETVFLKMIKDSFNYKGWINRHCNEGDKPYGSPEFYELSKQTSLRRYGTEYPMQSQIIKQRLEESMITKYGVSNFTKTDIGRKQSSIKANIHVTCPHCNKTGQKIGMYRDHFDRCKQNPNRIPKPIKYFTCPHCNKTSTNGTIMGRWHFDNCRNKPTS